MDLLPGFIAGISRVIISYPFDFVKCHIQTNTPISLKNIKLKNLYKGATLPFLTVPIDRAITFSLYDYLKKNNYGSFKSSLIVNFISCIYNVPIQVYNLNYILKNIKLKNNLYKGVGYEYIKNLMGGTIFLYVYDSSKDSIPIESNILKGLFGGFLASVINWSFIYPIDTVKTLIQTDFENKKVISTRIQKEGIKGLYKGIHLMYLKSIPSASISMMIYEIVKKKISNI